MSSDPIAAVSAITSDVSPATPMSANQLKKQAKKLNGGVANIAVDPVTGERLYARKKAPPPQKQRKDIILMQNPNRTKLRRWGHTCTSVSASSSGGRPRIVAWGGWGADTHPLGRTIDHRLNSIAVFQPEAGALWQTPHKVTGTPPAPREQHSAVLIPAVPNLPSASSSISTTAASTTPFSSRTCISPHLLIFGGRSNPSHPMHDVSLLNLDTYEWLSLPTPELGEGVTEANLGRFRHTAVWHDHRMIVYGGCRYEKSSKAAAAAGTVCTTHTVFNDILILDTSISPMRWERITIQGFAPAAPVSLSAEHEDEISQLQALSVSSSPLPSLPHKHTHAAVLCATTGRVFFFGGYNEGNCHKSPDDNSLYCLNISEPVPQWSWSNLSLASVGTPPPPISSSTLHLLSQRYLLVLGGVSITDMYSLSSLWIFDLVACSWSRPLLNAGPHARFHPLLERAQSMRENRSKYERVNDEELEESARALIEQEAIQQAEEEDRQGICPVRIVEHSFICKHAAVLVENDSAFLAKAPPPASFTQEAPVETFSLLLCGGGGNVFHFNPFFNPSLHFLIRFFPSFTTTPTINNHALTLTNPAIQVDVMDVMRNEAQAIANRANDEHKSI